MLDFDKIRRHLKLSYKNCHPELLKNDDDNKMQENLSSLEKSLNTNLINKK
ncbi:hypothetical protein [Spiroplasma poulsonii]|uniref:hypothetical protein n=1 Tax=Spiroplasma poulsonii TaxID=2138 RepID=UPI000AF99867|nr:hypothetical protein [Spiroplasma poulsonii]